MKYESAILKRLIDTYGVVGNPRYISEIIKEFILQGKECYPNLFTYQSDWLAHIDEFGLNPTYTVSYTGQSIYAPNTLERPVKSAILKGQTLVNLATITSFSMTTGGSCQHFVGDMTLNPNTYTVIADIEVLGTGTCLFAFYEYFGQSRSNAKYFSKSGKYIWTENISNSKIASYGFYVNGATTDVTYTLNNLVILEGDYTNIDIPFFEGMQSVKMPVLTTTGKNLYSSEVEIGGINNSTGVLSVNTNTIRSKNPISVKENTTYTISNDKEYNNYIYFYSADGIFISYLAGRTNPFTFTTPSGTSYIRTRTTETEKQNDLTTKWQLEKSSSATSYEPFKSNILTVNEDVTLRGIGNVQDELDCLTGEMTQRIVEIMLDGSEDENWTYQDATTSCNVYLKLQQEYDKNYGRNLACDKLRIGALTSINHDNVGIGLKTGVNGDEIIINVLKSSLDTQDKQGFKKWLSENPITFQYPLLKESIKTVDLTILDQNGHNVKQLMSFNGGTHFNTKSLEGSPLPSISVTVETDLVESLKVCSLEGNTM